MKLMIHDNKLTNIANALRNRLKTEKQYDPDEMVDAINDIYGEINGPYMTLTNNDGGDKFDTITYYDFDEITSGVTVIYPHIVIKDGPEIVALRSSSSITSNSSLKDIVFPLTLKEIPDHGLRNLTGIKELIFPEGLTKIGFNACYTDTALSKVYLPDSLTFIGATAFYKNTMLETIFIPSAVTTIEAREYQNSPFYNCTADTEIYTDAPSKPAGWSNYFNNYSQTGKLTVHYGVTREEYEEIINTETEV